jgi:hypothetical protein
MKIYFIGRMRNGGELEQVSIKLPAPLSKKWADVLPTIIASMKFSEGYRKSMRLINEEEGLFIEAGNDILLVTDTQLSDGELSLLAQDILRYQSSLTALKKQVNLERLRIPFLHRVADLPDHTDKSTLSLLSPLREKLEQETNIQKKTIAELMINSMEDAIVSLLEGKIDNTTFKELFNTAVTTAAPVLEKQEEWKQFIDHIINEILKLFSDDAKNQDSTEKRFSFFANPNPLEAEIEQVKTDIGLFL